MVNYWVGGTTVTDTKLAANQWFRREQARIDTKFAKIYSCGQYIRFLSFIK